MPIRILMALAILLNTLDLIATSFGILRFGNAEGNPLLAALIERSWLAFMLVKGVGIPLLLGGLRLHPHGLQSHRRHCHRHRHCLPRAPAARWRRCSTSHFCSPSPSTSLMRRRGSRCAPALLATLASPSIVWH